MVSQINHSDDENFMQKKRRLGLFVTLVAGEISENWITSINKHICRRKSSMGSYIQS